VEKLDDGFSRRHRRRADRGANVVVATGGLSIPKIGATDLGYRIAKRFGLNIIEPRPGLVPLTFDGPSWQPFVPLAGIALEVEVETGSRKGKGAKCYIRPLPRRPAVHPPRPVRPGDPADLQLLAAGHADRAEPAAGTGRGRRADRRQDHVKKQLGNILSQWLPARLAEGLLLANGFAPDARLPDMADARLRKLGDAINRWAIVPTGSEGYKKAEVTLGGVDTRELSQQTMMANKVPGLYFIGETVDVTGWLGGYNFQWAWASGLRRAPASKSNFGRCSNSGTC
jgi:predicted flavoprotein YhiN